MTTKDTLLLYEQPQLPTFQNRVYPTAAEAKGCAKGDIRLVQDMKTGLVYNDAFDPKLMDYDGNYNNEQGVSRHFHQHLEMVAGIVERTMGRENLVEVGCGKGLFLEMLLEKGFDLTGFDPTYEGTNPRVKRHYFEAGVDVQGEGLILRHVLEHIQDPYDFLVELCKANGGKGRIYIEVPCFDWIMEHPRLVRRVLRARQLFPPVRLSSDLRQCHRERSGFRRAVPLCGGRTGLVAAAGA
jgi:hypothetical protein